MLKYSFQRLVHSIPVLILMSMIVFGMILIVPGDPVDVYLGPGSDADPEAVAMLRHELWLDRSIPEQYIHWVERAVLHGDLGRSVSSNQPVLHTLIERLPVTLELAVLATLLAVLVGVPLGVFAALRRNTKADLLLSGVGVAGLAIPNFWLAILMLLLFSVELNWLPASGYVPFFEDPVGNLERMVMPAVALALPIAGILMRQVRSSVIEVMSLDFVRTARSKGLTDYRVITRHAIPNAMIAPLTVLGVIVAHLLGGVLIIERIFHIPGTGSYVVEAIFTRDFKVVQGGALMLAVIVLAVNFVVDILYGVIDPRIVAERERQ
jgi:peptide/nickel transport system permease protein